MEIKDYFKADIIQLIFIILSLINKKLINKRNIENFLWQDKENKNYMILYQYNKSL